MRIVSGAEEARLTYVGVASDFHERMDALVVFNVGSRSIEVSMGSALHPERFASVPVGAAALSERVPTDGTVTNEEFHDLLKYVSSALDAVSWLRDVPKSSVMIGSGGAFVDLAFLSIADADRNWESIHLTRLTLDQAWDVANRVCALDNSQRRKLKGMAPARAGMSVGAAAIVVQLMQDVAGGEVIVSVRGLSDGLIAALHSNSQLGDEVPGGS